MRFRILPMWLKHEESHRKSAVKWFIATGMTCLLAGWINMGVAQAASIPSSEPEFRHRTPVQSASDPYTKPEPAYAKWGKLAVKETKERYPKAQVIDYLHVGRVDKSDNLAEECFKLWLRSEPREFGVYVTIVFNKHTEKVQTIQFRESPR